jgi:hypothetical protein
MDKELKVTISFIVLINSTVDFYQILVHSLVTMLVIPYWLLALAKFPRIISLQNSDHIILFLHIGAIILALRAIQEF